MFNEDISAPIRTRGKKSHRQRRQAKLVGTVERNEELPLTQPDDEWGEVLDHFEQLQRDDPTLQKASPTLMMSRQKSLLPCLGKVM